MSGTTASEADCICTPAISHRSLSCITSAVCSKPTLLACLQHQFKSAGGLAQKYSCSSEWLLAFINQCDLRYVCQPCRTNTIKSSDLFTSTSSGNTRDKGEVQIVNINNDIKKMHTDLLNKLQSVQQDVSALLSNRATNESTFINSTLQPPKQPTFADVVSTDVMKSVVSLTLKEQQKIMIDGSSIAVYGFPEEGDDYNELKKMFDYLGGNWDIVRHVRIGNPASDTKDRTIKVQFRTPNIVSQILLNSKYLKDEAYYRGVGISKWLSQDEVKAIKALRQQCTQLNKLDKSSQTKGQKLSYVVINGKIMQRDPNGKLKPYHASPSLPNHSVPGIATVASKPSDSNDNLNSCHVSPSVDSSSKPSVKDSNASISHSTQSKNGIAGSQVAPKK